MLLMFKYEENMDLETYTRYHALILAIALDAENPMPLLELVEFLLLQGLGKIALAVLKHALDLMKSSSCSAYDLAIGHILSQKLSMKYFHYYEQLDHVLTLTQRFHELAFLLAHVASYLFRLHCVDWAEVLFIAALASSS